MEGTEWPDSIPQGLLRRNELHQIVRNSLWGQFQQEHGAAAQKQKS